MTESRPRAPVAAFGEAFRQSAPPVVGVWLIFLVASFLQAKVPGVNEPHYLTKSCSYWAPGWCARDFFLASPDAHPVFYATFGAFTQWFTFATVAVVGRAAGLLILAIGWASLGRAIGLSRYSVVLAAVLFVTLGRIGNLSGEWIIGGIEGKVPAWGFGFLSAAAFSSGRLHRVALWTGLSICLHPVVGCWFLLAEIAAIGIQLIRRRLGRDVDVPRLSHSLRALGLVVVISLPGLWPAVTFLLPGADEANAEQADEASVSPRELQQQANYIQVFGRLKHHLDPMEFHLRAWWLYAALTAVWVALWRRSRAPASDRFHLLVVAAGLFTLLAVVFAAGPRPASEMVLYNLRAAYLKLYSARLFDVLLPVAVCFQVSECLSAVTGQPRHKWLLCTGGLAVMLAALLLPVSRSSAADRREPAWREVCDWIQDSTPADSLFVTPRESVSFKWFAQRAEYVNYKDCPQDAVGIAEWNRRLWELQAWRADCFEDGEYQRDELATLQALTGADYLLTHRITVVDATPAFENTTYRLYELPRSSDLSTGVTEP